MGKKIRFWIGALFGATLQYFYDPQSGQSRRALMREQISNWLVEAKDGRGESKIRRPFRTTTDLTDAGLRNSGGPLSAVDINERQSTQF
jgi:hypothetical protein